MGYIDLEPQVSLFTAITFCANLHILPLAFLTGRIEELQGFILEIISPPFLKMILYNVLISASASSPKRYWHIR